MCGRFARTSPRVVLAEEFGVAHFVNVDLNPRYNIAASHPVEAIIRDGAEQRLGPIQWGLRASATSTVAPINARAETGPWRLDSRRAYLADDSLTPEASSSPRRRTRSPPRDRTPLRWRAGWHLSIEPFSRSAYKSGHAGPR
ncbi:MAG: SOS response-associated peptidase family protein [Candidatus Binatia bacterium]